MSSAKQLGLSRRKLTMDQAREIRLSMSCNRDMAERYNLEISAIERVRKGVTYGTLQPDERDALEKRALQYGRTAPPANSRFSLAENLLIIGDHRIHGGDQDRQEAMDAAHECRHGRLSHDRTPACGCWLGELAAVVDLPMKMTLVSKPEELAA